MIGAHCFALRTPRPPWLPPAAAGAEPSMEPRMRDMPTGGPPLLLNFTKARDLPTGGPPCSFLLNFTACV